MPIHDRKSPRSKAPGIKSFRAKPELLDRLDRRSMEETVHTGREVTATELILRGIDMVLATPVPGKVERRDCLVVYSAVGVQCLKCGAAGDGETVVCKMDGETVGRG